MSTSIWHHGTHVAYHEASKLILKSGHGAHVLEGLLEGLQASCDTGL